MIPKTFKIPNSSRVSSITEICVRFKVATIEATIKKIVSYVQELKLVWSVAKESLGLRSART